MKRLPDLGAMPAIAGISQWCNTERPLMKDDLLDKVVLLEFVTSSCANCIRVFPTLSRWHETYGPQGLIVLGIHTPEFTFERDLRVVADTLKEYGLVFPVAMDNDYVTWRNFQNRHWPTQYLFDKNVRLRYSHVGEGGYQETEAAIRELLKETGIAFTRGRLAKDEEPSDELVAENYLGYTKPGSFASPEKMRRDDIQTYSAPERLEPRIPALEGRWRVESERIVSEGERATILIRFDAKDVRAVIAPPKGTSATCRIRLDGKSPGRRLYGPDLVEKDGETFIVVDRPRTCHIFSGRTTSGTLEIACVNRGTSIYNVTFE